MINFNFILFQIFRKKERDHVLPGVAHVYIEKGKERINRERDTHAHRERERGERKANGYSQKMIF